MVRAPLPSARAARAGAPRALDHGTFALEADFPIVYAATVGALTSLFLLGARFAPAVGDATHPGPDAVRVRDQIVALLLDGMTGRAS